MTKGKHPEPPANFSNEVLPTKVIDCDLLRIHKSSLGALFFGKTARNRFDAPDRSYGVMYLGLDEHCCFIETFGQETGHKVVTQDELSKNSIATIRLKRKIKLVDITGSGLARIGADGRLTNGPQALARRWSKSFYEHRQNVDGIFYRACHDPQRFSIALFDKAEKAVTVARSRRLLSKEFEPVLADVLDTYSFELILA